LAGPRNALRSMRPSEIHPLRAAQEFRSRSRVRRCGFSLIEVLCAILVLGIGIVGLTEGLATALQSSKDSERQTAAVLVAAGQMETLRAQGYVVDGTEESDDDSPEGYHWQQIISRTDVDGLHDVRVIVWHGKSTVPLYELRTLLFDPPLLSSTSPGQGQRETDSRRRDRRFK